MDKVDTAKLQSSMDETVSCIAMLQEFAPDATVQDLMDYAKMVAVNPVAANVLAVAISQPAVPSTQAPVAGRVAMRR